MIDIARYVDFKRLEDCDYRNKCGVLMKTKNDISILKYQKKKITDENISCLGKLRSVVFTKDGVLSYSHAKSIDYDIFTTNNNINNCFIEEFVEGTMIHCFYTKDDWEIATKFQIGGQVKFYQDCKKTFREMFLESLVSLNLSFDKLDKKYSYIFILQHPENRIVVPFEKPNLVLLNVFMNQKFIVNSKNIYDKEFDELRKYVSVPKKYQLTSTWDELYQKYSDIPYDIVGVMIYNKNGDRTKIRNKNYEKVKKIKGNNTKIQFQYYELRKKGAVKEYLKHFPEHKTKFMELRCDLHNWTNELYRYYKKIYIKKEKIIPPFEYRPHLQTIHNIYIQQYLKRNKWITMNIVIDYINNLPSAKLMFSVNYCHRK